jgi:hypothetical protein
MRTAQRRQVVAFKTFLRTLLHEIVHHLDYELLELEDSLHTEGFYKRESSLFHRLVPDPEAYDAARADGRERAAHVPPEVTGGRKPAARRAAAGGDKPAGRRRKLAEQTHLPFGDS